MVVRDMHGGFLSVTATFSILAAAVALAGLSALVFLRADGLLGRCSVALFWVCLAATWLLAVLAAVTIQSAW